MQLIQTQLLYCCSKVSFFKAKLMKTGLDKLKTTRLNVWLCNLLRQLLQSSPFCVCQGDLCTCQQVLWLTAHEQKLLPLHRILEDAFMIGAYMGRHGKAW